MTLEYILFVVLFSIAFSWLCGQFLDWLFDSDEADDGLTEEQRRERDYLNKN